MITYGELEMMVSYRICLKILFLKFCQKYFSNWDRFVRDPCGGKPCWVFFFNEWCVPMTNDGPFFSNPKTFFNKNYNSLLCSNTLPGSLSIPSTHFALSLSLSHSLSHPLSILNLLLYPSTPSTHFTYKDDKELTQFGRKNK